MTNQPYPLPTQIIAARVATLLTTAEAAALVYSKSRSWNQWESGRRRMHPSTWALFLDKVARLKPVRKKAKEGHKQ